MPDGIAGIVQGYTGKPVLVSDITINASVYEAEFKGRFEQIAPRSVMGKLESDIERLIIPKYEARMAHEELALLIGSSITRLRSHTSGRYVGLRLSGMEPEAAFEKAMEEIGALIQAVKSGCTPDDFDFMLERQIQESIDGNGNGLPSKKI
ncbi:hypothetical protein HYX07_04615 [Candidatus Woesearchaeota archaeon]|nr:hypothetical protein [Candidatus Woesearchaeota archaeon]